MKDQNEEGDAYLQRELEEGDQELDRSCANLEKLDKEGDTIGGDLQTLKTGSDFLLGPVGEARAVRCELLAAIQHRWGVSEGVVWRLRKALGVGRRDPEACFVKLKGTGKFLAGRLHTDVPVMSV